MTTVLNRGGRAKEEAARSAAIYEAVLTELGATGTIVPLGDPIYRTGSTTFRSVAGVSGLETAVWTATEAIEAFDTPPTRQGICPVIHLNGSDESFSTPDDTYWSRGDGSNDSAFSVSFWVYVVSGNMVLAKMDETTGSRLREWRTYMAGNDVRLEVTDESSGGTEAVITDTELSQNAWHHCVVTYDGTGGTSANGGMTIYVDGASVAVTLQDGGTYVAMENSDTIVTIGANEGSAGTNWNHYEGGIAGGCAGICYVQAELTAEQVMNIYRLQKGALAL